MCGRVPRRGQDSNRTEGKGKANCQPTGIPKCSPSLESKSVPRARRKDGWAALWRDDENEARGFSYGERMVNRQRMTTQAARTGGPGGLRFSAGMRVGGRLQSKVRHGSPNSPTPPHFNRLGVPPGYLSSKRSGAVPRTCIWHQSATGTIGKQ